MQQTTTHSNLSEALRAAIAAHPVEANDALTEQIEYRAQQLDDQRLDGPSNTDAQAVEMTKTEQNGSHPTREAQSAYLAGVRGHAA